MKKISIAFFIAILLAACSTKDSVPIEKASSTDVSVSSDGSMNSISEKEALQIALDVTNNISLNTYPIQVGKYEIYEGVEYSDEEWIEISKLQKEMLQDYATADFIASNIQVDEADCAQTCTINIPIEISYTWKPTISITSDQAFTVRSLIRPFRTNEGYDYDSVEQTVDFIRQNDNWKVSTLSYERMDMNLTVADLEAYLVTQNFPDVTIDSEETTYEIEGVKEKAIGFTDNTIDNPFVVLLRTGHIEYVGENEEYEGDRDYSINNQDDYVTHNLFFNYDEFSDQIDLSNEQIAGFYDALLQLETQREAAYNSQDEQQLQSIIDELNAVLQDIYNYYEPTWDEKRLADEQSAKELWNEHFNYYFDNILDSNASKLERLNDEAKIRYNNVYGVLVTANF